MQVSYGLGKVTRENEKEGSVWGEVDVSVAEKGKETVGAVPV